MNTLDKGMIRILGGMEGDGMRFHYTTPNGTQFKTYALLIYGIFHLIFLDCGWSWVTEPWKVKPWIRVNCVEEMGTFKRRPDDP